MDPKAKLALNTSAGTGDAMILRLKIDRFRAFQRFDWFPEAGLELAG
jgi:putative ATP-dependent endonuclease of OLD family